MSPILLTALAICHQHASVSNVMGYVGQVTDLQRAYGGDDGFGSGYEACNALVPKILAAYNKEQEERKAEHEAAARRKHQAEQQALQDAADTLAGKPVKGAGCLDADVDGYGYMVRCGAVR